jgi:hypothetical protein
MAEALFPRHARAWPGHPRLRRERQDVGGRTKSGHDGVWRPLLLTAALLTWPALLNGYPLVFSDSGTYLSQALNRYLGWDRPAFYSLFLLPLHLGLTTWPVVAAQAIIAAWVLHVTCGVLLRGFPSVAPVAMLAAASSLPWFAAQLMPDLFTGLLVLALALLALAPERLGAREALGLAAFAAFAMAAHLSNLPLGLALLVVLLPLRRRLGARAPLCRPALVRILGAPLAAALALSGANLVGRGTPALAPYGNVFLLARVIYDGPGRDALARSCPAAGWRLCAFRDRLPVTADDFLWRADSPLNLAGGPKLVSAEADPIIAAAVRAEPRRELSAFLGNTVRQLTLFDSGDGLHAWPATVTPWIRRDFPDFEQAAYAAARQTTGRTLLPDWLATLHRVAELAGLAASLACLPGLLRRRSPLGGVIVAVVAGLLANAAITGGMSGPHARYQSRVMWLPVLTALLIASDRPRRAA